MNVNDDTGFTFEEILALRENRLSASKYVPF